ncbi:MAG: RNase adapter RapZ [Terriglobales bacterium]
MKARTTATRAQRVGGRAKPGRTAPGAAELHVVIITGLSGSGKGSAEKVFEDSGYYCVDNLPVGLLGPFVDLVRQTSVCGPGEVQRVAAVVDIREGQRLEELPALLQSLRDGPLRLTLLFLEASDEVILRRFSETRRPHPLAERRASSRSTPRKADSELRLGIQAERKAMARIRAAADLVVDTSRFNVHELRSYLREHVIEAGLAPTLQIAVTSFGFRSGLPSDADLVFDVRFLPNPNYIPALQAHDGRDRKVAGYIRSFPQTGEFLSRITALLAYLIPHYMQEGKSYLNIAVGCTGGRHRSVYIAEALQRALRKLGYVATLAHRDLRL